MNFYCSDHVASHPALYQKHLFVGNTPPTVEPPMMVRKRQEDGQLHPLTPNEPPSQFPSEEICTTISQWEQVRSCILSVRTCPTLIHSSIHQYIRQINSTNDFNNNKVEVVQEEGLQQYVFTYRCAKTKGYYIRLQQAVALSKSTRALSSSSIFFFFHLLLLCNQIISCSRSMYRHLTNVPE